MPAARGQHQRAHTVGNAVQAAGIRIRARCKRLACNINIAHFGSSQKQGIGVGINSVRFGQFHGSFLHVCASIVQHGAGG